MSQQQTTDSFRVYQRVVEESPSHLWTATAQGELSFANAHMLAYFGVSEAEMLGGSGDGGDGGGSGGGWHKFAHPADLALALPRWTQCLRTGEPYEAEMRLQQASDQLYYWHRMRAQAVRDEAGRIVGWAGAAMEINSLKRVVEVADARQEMAQHERSRLMRAFQYAPAVVALYTGPQHIISMANPRWEAFTGRSGAVGKPAREAFPEVEEQGLFRLLDQVQETGEPFEATEMLILFDHDGDGVQEETYWNLVLQPLNTPGEPVKDILSHAVEVTDLVLARRASESLRQEIEQLKTR